MIAVRRSLRQIPDVPAARYQVVRRVGRVKDSMQFGISVSMSSLAERCQTACNLNIGEHVGGASRNYRLFRFQREGDGNLRLPA